MDFAILVEIIETAGYSARSYSGRGMYGTECVGFVVDREIGVMHALMDLIEVVDLGNPDNVGDALYDLTGTIRNSLTDSMGLDTIIYFPCVKWEEQL